MEGLINVISAILIFVAVLLLTLLMGHIISVSFGYGWHLSTDSKGAAAVFGSIFGIVAVVAYFIYKYPDKQ